LLAPDYVVNNYRGTSGKQLDPDRFGMSFCAMALYEILSVNPFWVEEEGRGGGREGECTLR
jgi:hypothetical protein